MNRPGVDLRRDYAVLYRVVLSDDLIFQQNLT